MVVTRVVLGSSPLEIMVVQKRDLLGREYIEITEDSGEGVGVGEGIAEI